MGENRSNWSPGEVVRYLRLMRHDFLNHLQVISGYVQLKKEDMVLEYLHRASEQIQQMGNLLRLQIPEMALLFLDNWKRAEEHGIGLELKVDNLLDGIGTKEADLTQAVAELWDILWQSVEYFGENRVQVTIEKIGEAHQIQWLFSSSIPLTQMREQVAEKTGWAQGGGILTYVEADGSWLRLGARVD